VGQNVDQSLSRDLTVIVGLTGGMGSGKSTTAQLFRALQVTTINSDHITRQLVMPNQPALTSIIEHFGVTLLKPDHTLDRTKLRTLVFESPENRRWLEQLLHPFVKAEIMRHAAALPPGSYLLSEIPLLLEAHFESIVDRILVIDCTETQQLERVALRDHLSHDTIQTILNTQVDRPTRLTKATDIIRNEGTLEELTIQVQKLHEYYTLLATQFRQGST